MKIVISGKDGAGKVLLQDFLSQISPSSGFSLTAIDANPDFNSAAKPGFLHPDKFTPILEPDDPIEERMSVRSCASGSFFKLNPKENYSAN
jgi:CO dehydrogenase nickel-insertion accessory protein CooC1